jgi:hypothetical protein
MTNQDVKFTPDLHEETKILHILYLGQHMLTLHRPTATQDCSEPAAAAFITTFDRSYKRNESTSVVS